MVRANQMENASLPNKVKTNKENRGSLDLVTDLSSNITVVRWKDNKVVNDISTLTGKQPIQQVKRYYHRDKRRVTIVESNIIIQYSMYIGGVDHMDQNILIYMINLRAKKWWWPHFRFAVDVAVNNAYQIYRQFQSRQKSIQYPWLSPSYC